MTLVVLALDALDHGIVEKFECDGFRLETHSAFESVAHKKDRPITLEAWTSIATGVPPAEHGIPGENVESNWSNPVLDLASALTSRLPLEWRKRLGDVVRSRTGARNTQPRTDRPHMFQSEGRFVRNWPGIGDGTDLAAAWEIMRDASEGRINRSAFERRVMALAGEQMGWLKEMSRADTTVVGAHVHALDAVGHAYTRDREAMERMYRRVELAVEELRAALGDDDDLLLLSDHGICAEFMGDDTSHVHSWRAFVSSTADDVPAHALDVLDWVDAHAPTHRGDAGGVAVDRQQLENLGYI